MSEHDDDLELDEQTWPAQEPSAGFADRVVASALSRRAAKRKRAMLAAGVTAVAVAASVVVATREPKRGEISADARTEAKLGDRALVVAEAGAHITYVGDDVTQDKGDVFYRVTPGARFVVHTPQGDVEVKGTCFRVRVEYAAQGGDEAMGITKRDAAAVAAGSVVAAGVIVGVYEGRVAVTHAAEHMDLAAGEGARATSSGLARTEGTEAAELSAAEGNDSAGGDPLLKANANLVDTVGAYRRKLDALKTQREALESRLQVAEEKLAKVDGGPPAKSEFDLDQNDWKALADTGSVKYRVPCDKKGYVPAPKELDALGLAPDDGAAISEAYARSRARTWATIRPLCVAALHDEATVDKLGPQRCAHLIATLSSATDDKAAALAMVDVGDIRAGNKPMPAPGAKLHPLTQAFLALTGEPKLFEADLAQSFGPEEAHRIAWSDGLCFSSSSWGGGKKRPKP